MIAQAVPEAGVLGPLAERDLRVAAVLLVAGTLFFWAGAFTPPWRWWAPIPVREYLELIAAHKGTWRWIASSFALGVLLTLAGLVVLGSVLSGAGDRVWSDLGQAAFLFGSVLWVAAIAFRATVTVTAAEQVAAGAAVPAWFEPLRDWSTALFAVYMVLAYLAIAAYGLAILATGVAPAWLGRTHVVFGLAGVVGFVARVPVFDPPLMIHLVPAISGATLLWRLRGG